MISDYFKDIKSFDYFDKFDSVTKEYTEIILNELFDESKKVVSVIKPSEKNSYEEDKE